MKRIVLLAFLAFTSFIAYSKYVIVNVEIPGTLDYEVAKQMDWETIDSLKIIGGINGNDIKAYRRMARGKKCGIIGGTFRGGPIYGEDGDGYFDGSQNGKLKYLDLSDANIVAGGDAYATAVFEKGEFASSGYGKLDCYAEDNVVGTLMLAGEFEEVILPKSATRIDGRPIGADGISALEKIKFPDWVKCLPAQMFWSYRSLESVELPTTLEGIGDKALCWFGSKNMKNPMKIPSSVRYVGRHSFSNSSVCPDDISNLVYIGDSAFCGQKMNSTTLLRMPSVVYIGSHRIGLFDKPIFENTWETADLTFSREACKSITDTRILRKIEGKPFSISPGFFRPILHTLKVRIDNPELYGDTICVSNEAFRNFSELKVEIPDGQWFSAGESSFEGCTKLESLPLTRISWRVVMGCSSLKTLNFKTSKFVVDNYAFFKVEDIIRCFEGCTSLQNFNGPMELVGAKEGLVTKDGCLYYNDGKESRLLIYPWGRENINYTEDFANHYDDAFKYCVKAVGFNLKSGDFPAKEMQNFPNLKSVTVEPSTRYKVIDDIVYEKGWTDDECGALACYPEYRATFETLTIENSWLPYAFYGKYPSLRTVVIPQSITGIKGLLPNAENLLKIVCESETPPTLDKESLKSTRSRIGAIVMVPKGSYNSYKNAANWKEFNIVEYDSVDEIADGAVVVAADGRTLVVTGADGQRIEVFGADGRMAYSGTDSRVELPQAGIYAVRVGSTVKKVAVK